MEKIKEKNMLSKITEIYIIVMIIIFPICVDSTGFFKILECKYQYFLAINSIYISSIIITILYYLFFKKNNIFKEIKLSKIQWSVIVFLIINIISTFLSPFFKQYNLFVGVGRAEGLISITLYCLSFINITIFGKFKKRYILYFSIGSIIFNLIAILQYIGFNPFNMYQDGIGTHNVSFIGTIGNVAFVSTYYCIYLTISMAAFVFLENDKIYIKIIHLLSIYMGFFIFEVLDVLSGDVAFLGILVLTIPFVITNSKRLSKLLIVIAMIVLGYLTNIVINPIYYYDIGKIVLNFQINAIAIALATIIGIFIGLAYILKNREFDLSTNKKTIKILYSIIILCFIFGIIAIYFINFSSGFLYEIHELLHGNLDDDFGTYRIFLWKRSISLVKEYPIIGTGPDTFAIRFMDKYTQDVAELGELTINDTAANSYLTILVNTGWLGVISYITCITLQIINSIKKSNKYSTIFFIAFICFLIQDCFNLWVVIITPIYWILMAIMFISTNKMEEKNEKNN